MTEITHNLPPPPAAGERNSGWKIEIICQRAEIDLLGEQLDGMAVAIAAFEIVPDGDWRLEAYMTDEPVTEMVTAALATHLGTPLGTAARQFRILPLPPTDWLAENRRHFPPQGLGRFFIYGSYYEGKLPKAREALLIEAATAFGSGEHATTRLCLQAITDFVKARQPKIALDLGTGSGILSLALARISNAQIFASDIDANAVRVACQNARLNRVARQVHTIQADGLAHRQIIALRRGKPWQGEAKFHLVIANILAGPLCDLAREVGWVTAPGGQVILSGLLINQEAQVIAAYRQHHFAVRARRRHEGWSCLILTKMAHG